MGLLSLGTPLPWSETKPLSSHVHEHGITQFLHTYRRCLALEGSITPAPASNTNGETNGPSTATPNGVPAPFKGKGFLWGDEIEYMVVKFEGGEGPCEEKGEKRALLSLRQGEILQTLENVVLDLGESCDTGKSMVVPTFHPEYGRFMLESTPGAPYSGTLKDLISVEDNMRFRRKLAKRYLRPDEVPMTVTSYPRLGCRVFKEEDGEGRKGLGKGFSWPEEEEGRWSEASRSLFVGEGVTNKHARFPTLTANIRSRRGSKVAINVPIYKDVNTPSPFVDPTIPHNRKLWPEDDEAANGAAKPDHIYMDAMAFGMGCCCLQITFQAWNLDEARRVYDALVPVTPIMLALTAASPAFRGYLADVDARWDVIAGSVDDRTEEERGLKPLKEDKYRIPKSRYDSVDRYIANDPRNREEFNDIECPFNEDVFKRLQGEGIDDVLAKHIAHLFIRDPLVIFSERIDQDDSDSMDHFENIQSTNWQTMRFKPPPVNSNIGWRVEFRSMEVQLTDFENAAFSVFIVLLTRAIVSFNLNFYMPISQVDINMKRAQLRDASRNQKFFFRRWVFPLGRSSAHHDWRSRPSSPARFANGHGRDSSERSESPSQASSELNGGDGPRSKSNSPTQVSFDEPSLDAEEMTVDEIINGKDTFPGLLGFVNAYLNSLNVDHATKCQIRTYLDLIKHRAQGKLLTPAAWIRNFIVTHPSYKQDSVVSDEINHDLMRAIDEIERGTRKAPELLGKAYRGSDC